jgi:hypothetical protein
MKLTLSCLLLLGLAVTGRADVKEAEEQVKQVIEKLTKAIETMAGVKDKAGAEKAKPQLVKFFDELDRAGKEFGKLSDEDKKKIEDTYRNQFDNLRKRYRAEIERLRKDPDIAKVFADLGPFKKLGREKITIAQYKIALLDQAVNAYRVKNEKVPETLEALTEGDKPIVEKTALKDAWGKAFQYDPKGPKNKGTKPDIWTVDPEGKTTIGNWEEKPAPPKDK